jgi:hypothetical protein
LHHPPPLAPLSANEYTFVCCRMANYCRKMFLQVNFKERLTNDLVPV